MPTEKYDFAKEFEEIYISKQSAAPSIMSDSRRVRLQSYPPLGQVTQMGSENAAFTAVLEIPRDRVQEPWEVSLWLSVDQSEWKESRLDKVEARPEPQTLQCLPSSMCRLYFSSSIPFSSSVQFTLRFRHDRDQPWKWISDEQGLRDGHIVASSSDHRSDDIQTLIADLNGEWKATSHMSQAPETQLWSLEATILRAQGDTSTFKDIEIGMPWGVILRWFALVRLWSPWLAPRQGRDCFSLDKEAVLCCFMNPQGRNLVFLAVNGLQDVLYVMRSTEKGGISVHARNDGTADETVTVLVSEGADLERAVAAVMYHARTLVSRTKRTTQGWDEQTRSLTEAGKPTWEENWHDGLGYCTWNGLGQKLTEGMILDAVKRLYDHGINITSLIIDDNWQSIDFKGDGQFQYAWLDFEAERKAFPDGLKAMVSRLRQQHPGLQHIAVWHALLGYWGGISPTGRIGQAYKTVEVVREESKRRNLPLGGRMTIVAKEDVEKFYDDFYRFLIDAGIDGVKTDAQFMIDTWAGAEARRELINTYLDVWTTTSFRYFGAKAISCMSQFPQAMFRSQMLQNRPPLLVRNSDDFFPEIPASHPWHVWANAHNSIFMQYLNVLPDWDMFQTVHSYSEFHAAARCVSGGPIYITDVPGEHNMELIRQMTGITPRGATVIFRPSVVGKSIAPYTGYDDNLLLKVGSYHGDIPATLESRCGGQRLTENETGPAQSGTGIVGLFNISARSLTEIIPLSDFPGTGSFAQYVVRAHTTGRVSEPMKPGTPNSLVTTTLDVRGYEILCAFPLVSLKGHKHGNGWAGNFGLVGKMTGCAAIASSRISQLKNGRVSVKTRLRALGVLGMKRKLRCDGHGLMKIAGIYVSTLPTMTIDDDIMTTMHDRPIPRHTVSISKDAEYVLEVDIETAWKEMGLHGGQLDEVEVKIDFDA
ncbi:putative galactinol--sucrose galactosyltransferase 6 [Drechmeria coniospora]|uniref:Putative galactinol--sucrose galactosyltransferase 6 n=1 Tax=Drechmeria coniospora TaxID=98403 RepID=A0A151GCC0_DRECN|nr:putative galactinol--sucrose galactosyltransferase 6 [Drechmeria coniospora]KYK54695.1 putative galactinol--sucrose galactosyltransferase 6 [Drechmeria coniospora]